MTSLEEFRAEVLGFFDGLDDLLAGIEGTIPRAKAYRAVTPRSRPGRDPRRSCANSRMVMGTRRSSPVGVVDDPVAIRDDRARTPAW